MLLGPPFLLLFFVATVVAVPVVPAVLAVLAVPLVVSSIVATVVVVAAVLIPSHQRPARRRVQVLRGLRPVRQRHGVLPHPDHPLATLQRRLQEGQVQPVGGQGGRPHRRYTRRHTNIHRPPHKQGGCPDQSGLKKKGAPGKQQVG